MRITIWNEYIHERTNPTVQAVYPDGIHTVIAKGLRQYLPDARIECATLDQPHQGLGDALLQATDVLYWWGHAGHAQVADSLVDRIQQRVLEGMGLIVLHSGHASKIFKRLMGTSCMLRWREAGERERLWIVAPGHPIVADIKAEYFEIPAVEMYGEFFDIPTPDELILVSWFQGGEVFRSGCTFRRGKGKIFYFRPGHETHPIYYQKEVQQILARAAQWAMPAPGVFSVQARNVRDPLEPFARIPAV